MEVFQAGGECVGEKLPLEGTQGCYPLQTVDMHRNLEHTTGKGQTSESIMGPL